MAVISEVKCGRCDRRYSGFRSRCPYCGARRNKRGKHAENTENKKAKLIIGVLLILVLIGATIVLIITNLPDKTGSNTSGKSSTSASTKPTNTDNEHVTTVSGSASPAVSPSVSPSPTIDANVKIAAIQITYNGVAATDVTMGKIGDTLVFKYQTTPASANKVANWKSSNKDIFVVIDGKVTANGKGTATLSVTVDGITSECIIRVRGS